MTAILLGSCSGGDARLPPERLGDALRRSALASDPSRLRSRPRPTVEGGAPTGLQTLALDGKGQSYLYVPKTYDPDHPAPLIVVFHGAGANARKALGLFLHRASDARTVLFAPKSERRTWDLMFGGYGRDVRLIDRALEFIFHRYAIDPRRVAVAGFSDGASYALSLGLSNGDLFEAVIALSPGFMAPRALRGRPRVFIAHGARDGVLSFENTRERIVALLERRGYDVTFRPHSHGHSPRPRLEEAFSWFVNGSRAAAN